MKIVKNEALIERNGKIGNWISLASLATLGIGMYLSVTRVDLFVYSMVCLIVGFILTQIGMYLGAKFGRSPRPDEKIDAGLKGLHSEFNIYHYTTPTPHLLVGPAGVWVIRPYHQRGSISYENNRWRMSGGGFLQGYMRIFGQENLGSPDYEAESQIASVKKFLSKKIEMGALPEIKAVIVFTDESVDLNADDSPIPAMKLKQLKEFMRQGAKNRALSSEKIVELNAIINKDKENLESN